MVQERYEQNQYYRELRQIALPISLQCLLQSSFSVVDQIMIGQLGSVSIAAIGLGGKFISLLMVMVQAVAAVAGIIMAQAVGKSDKKEVSRGLYTNLLLAFVMAAVFTLIGSIFPKTVMSFYSKDTATIHTAARYLKIYAISFLPTTIDSLFSAYLRCHKETKLPLYAGIVSAIVNTGLNYLLIYGICGLPALGVSGAAYASVLAQVFNCLIILIAVKAKGFRIPFAIYHEGKSWKNYLVILLPVFVCEFLWALGENVYGMIYGHIGTKACAAMTLMNPVVSLMIGTLSGVAQAAGIMIGQLQGEGNTDGAYRTSKKLMRTGAIGASALSCLLLLTAPVYVRVFQVEQEVRQMAFALLVVFAFLCPVKVANMILGGGILRSGGKTKYVMYIDIIVTWLFGVPMGLLAAFIFHLPIASVYLLLSLEEVIRLLISIFLFRRKIWMNQL